MHLYQEFAPHPALAAHVACLWTSRALPQPSTPVLTVAVRFLPGAARAFFDMPLHLLQDQHPALDDLWPRFEAEALAAALWDGEQTIAQRLATLDRALLARLHAHRCADAPARADALVRTAVRLLEQSGGALRVDDLAGSLQVSRQHLALQFRERVGISAKTFAMVCQFRQAHAALKRVGSGGVDWARLAGECGYYDQSHLVHAFRQFADETPASFHFSNTRT